MRNKWFIKLFVLNDTWTKLGKYMEPDIFYRPDHFFKRFVGGYCKTSWFSASIYIRHKYQFDEGIKKHELCHARQFGRFWLLHTWMYQNWQFYRLVAELEAYREQVKAYKYTKKLDYAWIVNALKYKYNLNMDREVIQEYADYIFMDLLHSDK